MRYCFNLLWVVLAVTFCSLNLHAQTMAFDVDLSGRDEFSQREIRVIGEIYVDPSLDFSIDNAETALFFQHEQSAPVMLPANGVDVLGTIGVGDSILAWELIGDDLYLVVPDDVANTEEEIFSYETILDNGSRSELELIGVFDFEFFSEFLQVRLNYSSPGQSDSVVFEQILITEPGVKFATLRAVPEPSVAALLFLAFTGLVCRRRSRKEIAATNAGNRILPGFAVVLLTFVCVQSGFAQNDPYFHTDDPAGFPGQWHLDKQDSGAVIDVNIRGAWDRGLTGQGVTIGIVEDAFDYRHPDLAPSYAAEHSWDFFDDEPDPSFEVDGHPTYSRHATAVAGVAAARGGNGIGVTGAAPNTRMASLAASTNYVVTDFATHIETDQRLGIAYDYHASSGSDGINIFSASIGNSVAYLSKSSNAEASIERGGATGAIYVLGAANQRSIHASTPTASFSGTLETGDTGMMDLRNMHEVITVAAVGSDGKFASYSNFGSSVFVSAPSSSDGLFRITTTDNTHNPNGRSGYNADDSDDDPFPDLDYTSTFGGTSSATPLVSGVLALAKEANPNLDTRFAKHLIARTSQKVDLDDDSFTGGWITNGAGLSFNNNYGFGVIDADVLTLGAEEYSGVSELVEHTTGVVTVNEFVPADDILRLAFDIQEEGLLEEIEITLDMRTTHSLVPGDLEGYLISPSGTTSRFFTRNGNARDLAEDEIGVDRIDWTYLSNAFWGEDLAGEWTLEILDVGGPFSDGLSWDFRQPTLVDYEVNFRTGTLISAVPEPSSLIVLFLASAYLIAQRRK